MFMQIISYILKVIFQYFNLHIFGFVVLNVKLFCIRFLLLEKAPCISDHCCLEVEQAWVCLQHQSLRFLCLVLLFKTILKLVLSKIFFFVFQAKDQS